METNYPSMQKFIKMDKWDKYSMVSDMRTIAVKRREIYGQNLRGDIKYKEKLNKNFMKSYEKLMGEVGVYKRGKLSGHLKRIPLNVSNKKLNELYQSYSAFMRTDLYTRNTREAFSERFETLKKSLRDPSKYKEGSNSYEYFKDLTDEQIQGVVTLYTKMGDLFKNYGSDQINPIYQTFGDELSDELLIDAFEEERPNYVYAEDAAFAVITKLMPKILTKEIKAWQSELNKIGYTEYSAEELVKQATKGTSITHEGFRANTKEDTIEFVKDEIRQIKRDMKKK